MSVKIDLNFIIRMSINSGYLFLLTRLVDLLIATRGEPHLPVVSVAR